MASLTELARFLPRQDHRNRYLRSGMRSREHDGHDGHDGAFETMPGAGFELPPGASFEPDPQAGLVPPAQEDKYAP